jgi:hypothetical protein
MMRLAFSFLLSIGAFLLTGFGQACLILNHQHPFSASSSNHSKATIDISNDPINIIQAFSNNGATGNSTESIQATEIEEEECPSSGRKSVSISNYSIALFSHWAPTHLSKQFQGRLSNNMNAALHSPAKYLFYRVIKI